MTDQGAEYRREVHHRNPFQRSEVLVLAAWFRYKRFRQERFSCVIVGRSWTSCGELTFWIPKCASDGVMRSLAFLPSRITNIADWLCAGHTLAQVNEAMRRGRRQERAAAMEPEPMWLHDVE